MKQRLDRALFWRSGVVPAVVGLALMSAALAGCASATIDNAVPTASNAQPLAPAATAPAAETAAPVDTASSGAPRNSGTFPNLNIKPQVATEQITPEEKQAQVEAMTAAQQQQAAKASAPKDTTDPVLLRKLAATHANDALKAIEAEQ